MEYCRECQHNKAGKCASKKECVRGEGYEEHDNNLVSRLMNMNINDIVYLEESEFLSVMARRTVGGWVYEYQECKKGDVWEIVGTVYVPEVL